MKSVSVLFLYIIFILTVIASTFLGVGLLLSLIFPISAFHGAIILLIPFCIGILYISLNDIASKLGSLMDEEDDYIDWDDLNYKLRKRKNGNDANNNRSNNIIVMKSVSYDKEAPCPCGSGEKYKNCCGKKHLEKE